MHPASLKIKTTETTQCGNPRAPDGESDRNVGHPAGQPCHLFYTILLEALCYCIACTIFIHFLIQREQSRQLLTPSQQIKIIGLRFTTIKLFNI
jgi:hypothetical protein